MAQEMFSTKVSYYLTLVWSLRATYSYYISFQAREPCFNSLHTIFQVHDAAFGISMKIPH